MNRDLLNFNSSSVKYENECDIVDSDIGQTSGHEVKPKNNKTTLPRKSLSDKEPSGESRVKLTS